MPGAEYLNKYDSEDTETNKFSVIPDFMLKNVIGLWNRTKYKFLKFKVKRNSSKAMEERLFQVWLA